MAQGGEALLRAEPAASMRASAVCWRAACVRRGGNPPAACVRRGGNPPAPAFPRRGKRERGNQSSLLPQAVLFCADCVDAISCAVYQSFFPDNLPLLKTSLTNVVDPLLTSVPDICRHLLLAVLLSALSRGRPWARCILRSDLRPRSVTVVMDLGCWVLPSRRRSLKDHSV
jgi:hypothetical protein